jgi:sugar lactone lactonase YvrE
MSIEIERIGDSRYHVGEGPLWDPVDNVLYFVDIPDGAIFQYDPDTHAMRRWDVPSAVGALALRELGGAVLACGDGFHFFDFATGERTPISDPEANEPRTRLNDGKVDRRGRFVAGSMDSSLGEPLGALYALDADSRLRTLETGVRCSNGPCWSPAGRTFYFSDTPLGRIFAYDYDLDSGDISNKRVFVSTRELDGSPDGATVDADGCVWSAIVMGSKLARFTPDGTLERTVEMPANFVSSMAFGGSGLDVLYVTSIGEPVNNQPASGAAPGGLFAVHGLGVTGLVEPRFAG